MKTDRKKIARGQTLHKIAKTSKLKISEIAEKAGYKYSTFFAHIKRADLPFEILAKYGIALSHDFSEEFPEMDEFISTEAKHNYGKELNYEQLAKECDKWREKYYLLLEKYNKIIEAELNSGKK